MNRILLIFLFISFTLFAQDINKITLDSKTGKPMLIGICNREAFADTNFAWWFNSGYKFYHADSNVISELDSLKNNITITIVMGTWCSDSRREVPRFYKILDEINISGDSIKLINVNRAKLGNKENVHDLNIKRVPTFIVYSKGKEIGRIVETPNKTLESDLLNILK
jgi:thiol-disulfide isomerase/thioredoxin